MKLKIQIFILSFFFLCIIFLIFNFLFPINTSLIDRASSRIIYSNSGEILHMELSSDGYFRINQGLKGMPLEFRSYLLEFEDRYFYHHFGINPISIFRAFIHNLFSTRRIGASTITMQLARMLEKRERNYFSKIIECFRSLQLELYFTKSEILSKYLNIAPYGGNIEGIHTASIFYFNKKVAQLSLAEFAYLMILPKNPEVYKPSQSMQKAIIRRNSFYASLLKAKIIDRQKLNYLINEKIHAKRYPRKRNLPHFAQAHQETTIINSNINMDLQNALQKKLQKTVAQFFEFGVKNGACLIYDLEQNDYLVWLGSQDFYHKKSLGENDGVLAPRSPGSLLKPFIYAKSMDEGLITPNQLLLDIPMSFGEYSPQNFDKKYYGLISSKEALNLSLNIPAIDLNRALDEDLYQLINGALPNGLKHSKSYYGQGIVLGGIGLSLLDLVRLYSMFPNDGVAIDTKQSSISSISSTLVSKILLKNFRANLSAYWDFKKSQAFYAFKTGTSAQGRDLWTIGFNKRFIVGVWYGDFLGRKTVNTSGLSVASQTVQYAMKRLTQYYGDYPLEQSTDIKMSESCQDSIFRFQDKCNSKIKDDWIPNTSVQSQCRLLTMEKINYMQKNGLMSSLKNSTCLSQIKHLKPQIISPLNHAKIVISQSIPLNFQKTKFQCLSMNNQSKIHWFMDSKLIEVSNSGESIFLELKKGKHEISCVDDSSMSSKIRISVL